MGMFREVPKGNFDSFDESSNNKMNREVYTPGEANVVGTDKVEQKADLAASASQAENAKAFGERTANFRNTLNGQAPGSQEAVLGQVQDTMITAEDVAYLEEKFGRRLDTLRVMNTFSNVSENPIKAMSDLNRIINDVQKA